MEVNFTKVVNSALWSFSIHSETFSVQAFHYVNTQIIKYLDMMVTEKKESTAWAKRLVN